MPKFPTKQTEVLALARQMIAGYQKHGADFPSIHCILLDMKRIIYLNARKAQIYIKAQAQLATEAKLTKLNTLKEVMKNCLRKSEVDVTGNPEKLALIGWGPKAACQPVVSPSQPQNLLFIKQGPASIKLKWDRPTINSGGTVRNYIIERREQLAGSDDFCPWMIVGSALNNEIDLKNQPQAIQLEYRVKAANTAGISLPSNSIAVIL